MDTPRHPPSNALRRELARFMVATLPRFGEWATRFRDFDTPYGRLGYRQLSILWAIRFELVPIESLSPGQLAGHFDVQPSVMTRALAKLERSGFVVRSVDPEDGRRFHIAITPRGRNVSMFVEDLYTEDMLASMTALSDEQVLELRRNVETLGAIVDDLETRRKNRTSRIIDHDLATPDEH